MAVSVISSTEEAIRILVKWHTDSSKVRVTFANDKIFVTCHGEVYSVDDPSWIWCIGDEIGDEMRFNLEGAMSIASTNSSSAPGSFEPSTDVMDDFVSVTWADGTRLYLVRERRPCTII